MTVRTAIVFTLTCGILAAAPDRLIKPVDSSRLKVLKGLVHPKARPDADLGPADGSMAMSYVTLLLKPAPGLEAFLLAPHQPLTPEQFAERFGVSGNDMAKITAWLESQGLQVNTVARGRQFISFSGTARTVGSAFRTEIHRYRAADKIRFANATEPSIPADLESVVSGFRGLNNFGLTPMLRLGPTLPPDYNTSKGAHFLAPGDVATIYDVAPLYTDGINGGGQIIAVAGQTDIDLADIRAFRTKFNLPPSDPQVMVFGPDPGKSANDLVEADLDLEWSGAIAPNASIVYVNSSDAFLSAFYAIDNALAPVLSTSYGACESEGTPDFRTIAQQASAEGITWISSSGDSGASGCDFSTPTPEATKGISVAFPASFPEVTAIGGTMFVEGNGNYWAATNGPNLDSALGYIPETAWNESLDFNSPAAVGGGPSTFYPKPFWQTGPGVPDDGARDVPDVSLNAAADHDAYLVISGGSLIAVGGTSCGTPIFAGIVSMLNQYLLFRNTISQSGLGNINPQLYRLAHASSSVFHDVNTGTNVVACAQGTPNCVNGLLGFSAGPGFDLATGLGSVDAFHLVGQWNTGTTSTTSITASPSSANLNDAIALQATVTSSGGASPTGTVTFLASQNILGTVSLVPGPNSSSTASLGVSEVRIAEGDGRVQALYNGDAATASSGATTSVQLIIPATGSLVVPSVDPNPVYQFGNFYSFTVSLQELAGVATKLTGFTIDGAALPLTFFQSTNLPAFGLLQTTLGTGVGITPTAGLHVFGFTGADVKSGKTWAQQVTAVFLPSNAPAVMPSILLTSVPSTVQQNTSAPADCQWSQQLTVQEQGGFLTTLSSLRIGTTNFNNQIQNIFGTTRLAPFGTLYGNLCWNSANVTPSKTFTIGGVGEIEQVTSVATASYANAPAAPAAFAVSVKSLVFSGTGSAPIDITITGGDAVWTTSILPANLTTTWLTATPSSGDGPGRMMVHVSTAGLSNGLYRAYVTFQATNAFPQAINVPVTLVVGPSSQLQAASITNGASGTPGGAPGAQMEVSGVSSVSTTETASTDESLPLTLAGVSATVNGISAPLYSAGPGRIVLQVPYETAQGPAVLALHYNGQTLWQEFPVAIAAPGIFPVSEGMTAQAGQPATVYITGDGDVTPTLTTGVSPSRTVAAARLPKPRLPVTVTVAGTQAQVLFYGVISAGVTQVNFAVPPGTAPGAQSVIVTVGSVSSPPGLLNVTAP